MENAECRKFQFSISISIFHFNFRRNAEKQCVNNKKKNKIKKCAESLHFKMRGAGMVISGTWHSGLSPNSYYLVALPTNVKKCYGCGDMFAEKFRQAPHNIVVKHVDRRVVRRDDNTGALVYSTDFTNTYYHPNPAHIRRKNPVFDGRVLIDLGTYQSLDEGQKDILKEHGLVVNIVNS